MERACALLEKTDLPIERIAADSGFGTVESMQLHLRAELGVSSGAY
ncbi:hypothetical protein [Aeromicrobium sp. P5_D10]